MTVVQVEKTYKIDKVKYNYRDVKYDIDGWADAKKFLPANFDLCLLKTKSKTIHGWYSGLSWDGMNIQESDEILYWKHQKD